MLISRKYISLLLVSGLLFSCQDDETLNLKDFPTNQPSFTVDGIESGSNVDLNATYLPDRSLKLDGELKRTYTFTIQPSPQDAVVKFSPICTNIPTDKVELSATEVLIPAGSTETSVTVGLKDDDFSFAASTLSETVYELGVVANVIGYKMEQASYEAKFVIKKEAFSILASVEGPNQNSASFERTCEGDKILNAAPISYQFKVKFDKASDFDVKVNLTYEGIPEAYLKDISITPSEIVIPAGKLESDEITWSMKDDFVLSTEDAGVFDFTLKPTFESKEETLKLSEEKGSVHVRTTKSVKNVSFVEGTEGFDPESFTVLDRKGWVVSDLENFGWGSNGDNILDDNDNSSLTHNYNDIWGTFIVDMKEEHDLKGIEFKYRYYFNSYYATRNITISTSLDRDAWVNHGEVSGLPNQQYHYVQLVKPVKARYVKIGIKGYHRSYTLLSSIKMFE